VRPVRDPWKMRREQAPPASWPAVGRITASLESLWINARACGRLAAPRIWWIVRDSEPIGDFVTLADGSATAVAEVALA
jgi:hypothetical protein